MAERRSTWMQWVLKYKRVIAKQDQSDEERAAKMNKANPAFVLRRQAIADAIKKAEKDNDYTDVQNLLELSKRPYDEQSTA